MPFTALIYLLCYIDRSNIGMFKMSKGLLRTACLLTPLEGNARILNANTGDSMLLTNNMTNYEFTVALMIFLVAYSVFEAPSNLALKVFSPNV